MNMICSGFYYGTQRFAARGRGVFIPESFPQEKTNLEKINLKLPKTSHEI
jgi:hypothetical protein